MDSEFTEPLQKVKLRRNPCFADTLSARNPLGDRMQVEFSDLIARLHALEVDSVRVGLPDTAALVTVRSEDRLIAAVDAAIHAFRRLRPGTTTIIDANTNSYRNAVVMRIKQLAPSNYGRNGEIEPEISAELAELRAVTRKNRGSLHYWGGDSHFDIELPLANCDALRADFPEVDALPWGERYERMLATASWDSLRHEAFRNAALASTLSQNYKATLISTVYIPSVGICVHPWIFANDGFSVVACDIAQPALDAVSDPSRFSMIYSKAAYERWDISMSASYGNIPHPEHFHGMPALEEAAFTLTGRIQFHCCDWANAPIPTDSIDLVFAANALPRTSDVERMGVLMDWVRVIRPGGLLFIAQHHSGSDWNIESFLKGRDWASCDILCGETPPSGNYGGFQTYYSSG